MPYLMLTAIANVGNLYKKSPIVVGDVESDKKLMKYLGAKPTKKYPCNNSPTTYIVERTPRKLLNDLERKGYQLLSVEILNEHYIWTLYNPKELEYFSNSLISIGYEPFKQGDFSNELSYSFDESYIDKDKIVTVAHFTTNNICQKIPDNLMEQKKRNQSENSCPLYYDNQNELNSIRSENLLCPHGAVYKDSVLPKQSNQITKCQMSNVDCKKCKICSKKSKENNVVESIISDPSILAEYEQCVKLCGQTFKNQKEISQINTTLRNTADDRSGNLNEYTEGYSTKQSNIKSFQQKSSELVIKEKSQTTSIKSKKQTSSADDKTSQNRNKRNEKDFDPCFERYNKCLEEQERLQNTYINDSRKIKPISQNISQLSHKLPSMNSISSNYLGKMEYYETEPESNITVETNYSKVPSTSTPLVIKTQRTEKITSKTNKTNSTYDLCVQSCKGESFKNNGQTKKPSDTVNLKTFDKELDRPPISNNKSNKLAGIKYSETIKDESISNQQLKNKIQSSLQGKIKCKHKTRSPTTEVGLVSEQSESTTYSANQTTRSPKPQPRSNKKSDFTSDEHKKSKSLVKSEETDTSKTKTSSATLIKEHSNKETKKKTVKKLKEDIICCPPCCDDEINTKKQKVYGKSKINKNRVEAGSKEQTNGIQSEYTEDYEHMIDEESSDLQDTEISDTSNSEINEKSCSSQSESEFCKSVAGMKSKHTERFAETCELSTEADEMSVFSEFDQFVKEIPQRAYTSTFIGSDTDLCINTPQFEESVEEFDESKKSIRDESKDVLKTPTAEIEEPINVEGASLVDAQCVPSQSSLESLHLGPGLLQNDLLQNEEFRKHLRCLLKCDDCCYNKNHNNINHQD